MKGMKESPAAFVGPMSAGESGFPSPIYGFPHVISNQDTVPGQARI